ncbi:MAG TPA: hypothetical protein DIS59_04665 [Candidatus Magasanikbacteria bacterium]|nr:MAG: Riboflavin biosynthesis protein RibF [Candidatus Magasanikbacteria bacterium GW2011_GWA2_43_9]HCM54197.1 hypothetical protein [Candidatus Magasanikbacteria bacterium]
MIGGIIVHGDGLGKTLGYPTANIDVEQSSVRFESGVYAARATLHGKIYDAALVIIQSPWKVEAHLLDYAGPDIYGQELRIEPIQRVSSLERYDDIDELKAKIGRDITLVRQVFEDVAIREDRDDHVL